MKLVNIPLIAVIAALPFLGACIDNSNPEAIVNSAGASAVNGSLKDFRACWVDGSNRSDADLNSQMSSIKQTLAQFTNVKVNKTTLVDRKNETAYYLVQVSGTRNGAVQNIYNVQVACWERWDEEIPHCPIPTQPDCRDRPPTYRRDCWVTDFAPSDG